MDVFGDEQPDGKTPIASLSFPDDETEEGVITSSARLPVNTMSNGASSDEGEGGRMQDPISTGVTSWNEGMFLTKDGRTVGGEGWDPSGSAEECTLLSSGAERH